MATLTEGTLFTRLSAIQNQSNPDTGHLAFLDGKAAELLKFAHRKDRASYPARLESGLLSGNVSTVTYAGTSVALSAFPDCGTKPTLRPLAGLHPSVSHACLMLAVATPAGVKSLWAGKAADSASELWSVTKFLAPVLLLDRVCQAHPTVDVDEASFAGGEQAVGWGENLRKMVSYENGTEDSNLRATLVKKFFTGAELEGGLRTLTGNGAAIEFGRHYGGKNAPALFSQAKLTHPTAGTLATSGQPAGGGENHLCLYDLVRVLGMVGLHKHLSASQRLPHSQWKSMEGLVKALGADCSLFLDAALEQLQVQPENLVVLSKMGFGPAAAAQPNQMTYAAFTRFESVGRTYCIGLGLRLAESGVAGEFLQRLKELDTRMASQVAVLVQTGMQVLESAV